jgi:hypothetical protein
MGKSSKKMWAISENFQKKTLKVTHSAANQIVSATFVGTTLAILCVSM